MDERAFGVEQILYDLLCMHSLSFAVWSLRMKGLTQPCMHRFEPENNADCAGLQVKYEGKGQSLLHIPIFGLITDCLYSSEAS
jgi:hypothetical protein